MKREPQGKLSKTSLIFYGLGFVLLAYFTYTAYDDKTMGLITIIAYVPLFIFARYLQRHGGMGWQWPD